jgi:hypothetical protein
MCGGHQSRAWFPAFPGTIGHSSSLGAGKTLSHGTTGEYILFHESLRDVNCHQCSLRIIDGNQ